MCKSCNYLCGAICGLLSLAEEGACTNVAECGKLTYIHLSSALCFLLHVHTITLQLL
jgi:hypothetical protein